MSIAIKITATSVITTKSEILHVFFNFLFKFCFVNQLKLR